MNDTHSRDAYVGHAADDPQEHDHGWGMYAVVLAILLVLTGITVGASYINFGSNTINVIVAMVIASIKASLVLLFFMHLKGDKPINSIIFVAALFFLSLMLSLFLIDVESRRDVKPNNWTGPQKIVPPAKIYAQPGNMPVPSAVPGTTPAAAPAAATPGAAPAKH